MRKKKILKIAWKISQPLLYMAFPVYVSPQILLSALNKKISTSICHLLINETSKNKQGTASLAAEKGVKKKGRKVKICNKAQLLLLSAAKCQRAVFSFPSPSFLPESLFALLPPRSCFLDKKRFFPSLQHRQQSQREKEHRMLPQSYG